MLPKFEIKYRVEQLLGLHTALAAYVVGILLHLALGLFERPGKVIRNLMPIH
jgi:hypothetical protein